MSETSKLNIFSFTGKMKILHFSWIAFFITFFVWFNHAPLLGAIADSLGLSKAEIKTLLILNVALTIPARIIIGMLTDKYGPRITYACLLFLASIPCFMFALADDFTTAAISRFLLGFVGAGFVIGIRMVSEWFPANELGTAEGIYGGWGNFGSAAGAMTLPTAGPDLRGRRRLAICRRPDRCPDQPYFQCDLVPKCNADTPKGSTYYKPKKIGGYGGDQRR